MPTGYTADVANGTVADFRTFALRCARNFGATILQRDDPASELPKHREVGEYYLTRLERAKARAAEVAAMTLEDAARAAEEEHASALASYHRQMRDRAETRNRYNAMLTQAMTWQAPTPEHQSMKQFMIDQLTESRKFDCYYTPTMPALVAPTDWLTREIQRADEELDRATLSLAEEMERCANANAWIDALYASLPGGAS